MSQTSLVCPGGQQPQGPANPVPTAAATAPPHKVRRLAGQQCRYIPGDNHVQVDVADAFAQHARLVAEQPQAPETTGETLVTTRHQEVIRFRRGKRHNVYTPINIGRIIRNAHEAKGRVVVAGSTWRRGC